MNKPKKILSVIFIVLIVLVTIFILSDSVYAAISDKFAGEMSGKFNKKSLAGIYYAMRTYGRQWVDSPAPSKSDLKDWGYEGGANLQYGDKNEIYDDNLISHAAQYGIISRVGAICFGHEKQENEAVKNDICVIDIDDTSSKNYQYLAYHIRRSIYANENANTDNTSKHAIREWVIDNIEKITNDQNFIQTPSHERYVDYTADKAGEYANYASGINENIVYEEECNPSIIYKGEDTFIGPYSIKIKGNTEWSNLDKIKIECEGTSYETTYCSIDGKTITEIKNVKNNSNNEKYNNFYIVIKNNKITSVKSASINNTYKYYKARLVASSPHAMNGQNIAIFYGYPYTKNIVTNLPVIPYGTLQIEKKGEGISEGLTGIEFKVYSHVENGWLKLDENSNIVEYTTFDNATKLYTDAKGKTAEIQEMPVGKYDIYETGLGPYENIYELEEINVPGKEEKVKAKLIEKDYQISGTVEVTAENKQVYVSLSGYVWVDKQSSKQSYRNDLYNTNENPEINDYEDDKDTLLDGITVRLMDKTTGKTVLDKEAKEMTTETADGGKYLFEKISVDDLANYYIEFEYDGLTYTNVVAHIDKDNGSKAAENDRDNFNENFSVIEGKTENTSITKDTTGKEIHTLTYNLNKNEHTATLNNTGLYPITANTNETGYSINFVPGQEEIKYINLGLYEREQPDIALLKDLQNVKVSVNGYNHIYEYGSRFNNAGIYEQGFNVGVKFGIGKQDKYGNMSYSRPVYKADYEYTNEQDKSKELKVYATYKIRMINESSNLQVQVNSIVDYYDARYTIIKAGTSLDEQGNVTGYISHNDGTSNNKYEKAIINTNTKINAQEYADIYVQFELNREAVLNILNDGKNLNNVAEINSYSVFDEKGNVYAGVDKDSNPGNVEPEDKTTYQDDTDSAPGLKLEVAGAREMTGKVFLDSTSNELKIGEGRQGSGAYEEGETGIAGVEVTLTETTGTGKVYKTRTLSSSNITEEGLYGFIYDEEKELYEPKEYKEEESEKYAYTNVVKDNDVLKADPILKEGDFLIGDYIPGDYTLTYKWGDEKYTVQDYKGTIYDSTRDQSNKNWYKENIDTRLTDAIDNYETRLAIDNGTNTENKMDSITPVMGIGIEKETDGNTKFGITSIETEVDGDMFIPKDFKIKNIDFGIVERARQEIVIDKKVESAEIILANGQTVASFKYNEEGKIETTKGIVYIPEAPGNNGMIKAELDSELIQGATVNIKYGIKVLNNSELDYDTEEYYLYGVIPATEAERNKKAIKYIPSEIYDYIDNTLAVEQNEDWIVKEISTYNHEVSEPTVLEDYLYKYNSTSTDSTGNKIEYEGYESFKEWYDIEEWNMTNIQNSRMKRLADKTILYYDNEEIKNIIPGESLDIAKLNASKVLTNTDDISLNNDVEITKVTRESKTGREIKISQLYDRGETVTITPPTGESTDYILISTLGITFLITLATGIVFIKKKILK